MKKVLSILCAALLFVITTAGCKQKQDVKITYFHADWPYYQSLDSLTAAANNIFEGKVTNIFFDVVNMTTGESADKSDDPLVCMLYTIYEVEMIASYKGVNDGKAYIKVEGGIQGFKEAEQCEVMQKAGVFDENTGIRVCDSFAPLTLGDTYLFLTNKRATTYHTIINTDQFAFKLGDTDENEMFTYEKVKSYVIQQSTHEQS